MVLAGRTYTLSTLVLIRSGSVRTPSVNRILQLLLGRNHLAGTKSPPYTIVLIGVIVHFMPVSSRSS